MAIFDSLVLEFGQTNTEGSALMSMVRIGLEEAVDQLVEIQKKMRMKEGQVTVLYSYLLSFKEELSKVGIWYEREELDSSIKKLWDDIALVCKEFFTLLEEHENHLGELISGRLLSKDIYTPEGMVLTEHGRISAGRLTTDESLWFHQRMKRLSGWPRDDNSKMFQKVEVELALYLKKAA